MICDYITISFVHLFHKACPIMSVPSIFSLSDFMTQIACNLSLTTAVISIPFLFKPVNIYLLSVLSKGVSRYYGECGLTNEEVK